MGPGDDDGEGQRCDLAELVTQRRRATGVRWRSERTAEDSTISTDDADAGHGHHAERDQPRAAPSGRPRGPTATRPFGANPRASQAATATPTRRAATWSRPTRSPRRAAHDRGDERGPRRRRARRSRPATSKVGSPSITPRKARARADAEASGAASRPLGIRSRNSSPTAMATTKTRTVTRWTTSCRGRSRPPAYEARGEHERRPSGEDGPGARRGRRAGSTGVTTAPRRAGDSACSSARSEVLAARRACAGAGPAPRPGRRPRRPGCRPR